MALLIGDGTGKHLHARRRGEAGFSITEIVVLMAIVAIVSSLAIVRISSGRDHIRLTNAAREFANYAEKARIDSIRRHASGSSVAAVKVDSTTTYQVFMDFDYNGTPTWRTFTLPDGVTFNAAEVTDSAGTVTNVTAPPVTFSFDWRGRSATSNRLTFKNTRNQTSVVGLTVAGELSLDRQALTLGASTYTAPSPDLVSLNGGSATTTTTTAPTPQTATPTPTPPRSCSRGEKPAVTGCTCRSPLVLKSSGKCM
jgi:Tfp pilus assembly protein FimT